MPTKKRVNIFDRLFIIASIAGFIVLFFLIRNLNLFYTPQTEESIFLSNNKIKEEIFTTSNDPFITKNNKLEDDFLLKPLISNDDLSVGANSGKVTIVEFSDFMCKTCIKQNEIIESIIIKYKDNVRLIKKYYPDYSDDSFNIAIAAHCGDKHGNFWDFQKEFFNRDYSQINNRLFLDIAKKIGIDENIFNLCINDEKSFSKIKRNVKEARALKIPGVPFFFVGEQEILGEMSKEELEKIIEIELNR